MKNIFRIITLIPEYRFRVVIIILTSAGIGFGGTFTPFLFRYIINNINDFLNHKISYSQAEHSLMVIAFIFVFLRIAIVIISIRLEKESDALWRNTVSGLRQRVFDTMTGLSVDFYARTRAGDIMDRYGAITTITMWLFQLSEGTLAAILQLIFGTGLLLIKAPVVGIILLFILPLNLYLSFAEARTTRPYKREWHKLIGVMSGLLGEMVSQITTVRSMAGEPGIMARFDDVQKKWWAVRETEQGIEQRSGALISILNAVSLVIIVLWVSWGALHTLYSPGDILMILALTHAMITSLQPISRLINTTAEVDTSAERLVDLLDMQPTVTDMHDAITLEKIDNIFFENVSFRYPDKKGEALKNISFTINRGEHVALVGQSGSGKSTIIRLLLRFYDPQSGKIFINGQDIRHYTQASLRAAIGVVMQDVALFNDTIARNISWSQSDVTDTQMKEVTQIAHADEFINQLPEGYDTIAGERGVHLSGGEKQRIAIARALLRNPEFVILDEATSALDTESERKVQQGLSSLMQGRTALVIAHRLGTIRHADCILVMRQGRIVETGSHDELLRHTDGIYAKLYALQFGD